MEPTKSWKIKKQSKSE